MSLFAGLLIQGSIASAVPPGVFTTKAACPYQVHSVLPLAPACAKAGTAASVRSAKIFMSVPFVRAAMTPGISLVHKPVGQTSFSLVRSLMEEVRAAGIRRDRLPICHGGALDPYLHEARWLSHRLPASSTLELVRGALTNVPSCG